MYTTVKAFLEQLGSADGKRIEFSSSQTKLAVAVLLYRAMLVDGSIHRSELRQYKRFLTEKLGISAEEIDRFQSQVEQESADEASLFPFTFIVGRLPESRRMEIYEAMRGICEADSQFHAEEANLLLRTAQLLKLDFA